MKAFYAAGLAVLMVFAAGCYSQQKTYGLRGQDFDETLRDKVTIGDSREQVMAVMGQPHKEIVDRDAGITQLVYFYEKTRSRKQQVFGATTSNSERLVYKELNVYLQGDRVTQIRFDDNKTDGAIARP